MKNGTLGGFLGGLVGLAVAIFVVGYAWRMSQSRKSGFIPGASSEPGAAPPLQPDFENPNLARPQVERMGRKKMLRDNMNADGFFDGVYN